MVPLAADLPQPYPTGSVSPALHYPDAPPPRPHRLADRRCPAAGGLPGLWLRGPNDPEEGECFDRVYPGEALAEDPLCLVSEAGSDIYNVVTLMKQEWTLDPQANHVVSIPAVPEPNWQRFNSFRAAHFTPTMGLSRPDLVVTLDDVCTWECSEDYVAAWVRVGNQGLRDVNTPVEITLYGVLDDGDRVPVGGTIITDPIPAGTQLDAVRIDAWGCESSPVVDLEVAVDVGDSAGSDGVHPECDESNNEARWGRAICH